MRISDWSSDVCSSDLLIADEARGAAIPNFESAMSIVPDGAIGSAIRWSDGGYVAWQAPGNMYAQRGTLSFFWRSHTPAGATPFVIFRVGFAEDRQSVCRERVCQYV